MKYVHMICVSMRMTMFICMTISIYVSRQTSDFPVSISTFEAGMLFMKAQEVINKVVKVKPVLC